MALIAGLAMLMPAGPVSGQTSMSLHQLQASYVYSFVKFSSWPAAAFESAAAPVVLGVVQDGPLFEALGEVTRSKVAQSRPVIVRALAVDDSFADIHVLFVGDIERTEIADIIRRTSRRPVLTVSLVDRFAQLGGVIGLVLNDGKLGFEINVQAAAQQQIKVTQLLPLALSVRGRNR